MLKAAAKIARKAGLRDKADEISRAADEFYQKGQKVHVLLKRIAIDGKITPVELGKIAFEVGVKFGAGTVVVDMLHVIESAAKFLHEAGFKINTDIVIFDEKGVPIQASPRVPLLDKATNPTLRNIINNNHREDATFKSGSTADAIRFEKSTGKQVGGKSHIQKGEDSINGFKKLLKNRDNPLNSVDSKIAQGMINDLTVALKGLPGAFIE